MVRVRVSSDTPGTVLARVEVRQSCPANGSYHSNGHLCPVECVCRAPGDATLAVVDTIYRVEGPGQTPSAPFTFRETPSDVDVRVRVGSLPWCAIGFGATIAGIDLTAIGGGFLVSSVFIGDKEKARKFADGGEILLGVGLVTLAVGLPLWLANRTHVDRSDHATGIPIGSGSVRLTPAGVVF